MESRLFAMFCEGIGQVTHFIGLNEIVDFPADSKRHTWYQDNNGKSYSFFELYSLYTR